MHALRGPAELYNRAPHFPKKHGKINIVEQRLEQSPHAVRMALQGPQGLGPTSNIKPSRALKVRGRVLVRDRDMAWVRSGTWGVVGIKVLVRVGRRALPRLRVWMEPGSLPRVRDGDMARIRHLT